LTAIAIKAIHDQPIRFIPSPISSFSLQARKEFPLDTSNVIMPSRTRSSDLSTSGPSKPWRAPAPEPEVSDVDMDSDVDENNASLAREQPRHLDDPWVYPFQVNKTSNLYP
jgi:hypothetical protein